MKSNNFIDVNNTPNNVKVLLENSCYDCHSNETRYPKYSYIAPVSWVIKEHINEGRKHLNFSEWGSYSNDIKQNAIEKTISTIRNLEMPLPSYINYHPKSNLNKNQRELLENYFQQKDIN